MSEPNILIVGTGYVGLTCAGCFAHLGHQVTGYDIDRDKIESLQQGRLPIHEPGLDEIVHAGVEAGNLQFTTDPGCVAQADIVFLCLPTPPLESGTPDLRVLKRFVEQHRSNFRSGAVLVTKSTVPLGTGAKVEDWLDRTDVPTVSNPEFLREGVAVRDFLKPDRIVIGTKQPEAGTAVRELYRSIDTEIVVCDQLSAELIKYAANVFLATKLSLVNEMSRICDELGADIDAVVRGVGSDHRISDAFMTPGPGWGGSCFPKDVAGLSSMARASRLRVPVVEGALESNRDQFDHVLSRTRRLLDRSLAGATIAIWGLAFKAGTDDVRSSPAIELVERLQSADCQVRVHDPVAELRDTSIKTGDMYEVCADADLLVIATEWPQFAEADFTRVAEALRTPTVFDLRSVLPVDAVLRAGLRLELLGRRAPS